MTRPAWWAVALLNLLLLPYALEGMHFDDTDTFYHLAAGRWMAEHHRVLDQETFSFTAPGRPWTNYYWGFERLLYGAEQLGGLRGVVLLRGAFVLATGNLLLLLFWRVCAGAPLVATASTMLGSVLYLTRALDPRPHLASHLLLVVLLLLLEPARARERPPSLAVPLVFLAWANLHGVEYPVGLAVLGLYAAEALVARRAASRWLLVAALSVAALLANPFGARLLMTPLIAGDREVMALIDEMRPVTLLSLLDLRPGLLVTDPAPFHYAVLLSLAAGVAALWSSRWRAAGLVAIALALGLGRIRFRVEFALLAVPVIAGEAVALAGAAGRRLRGTVIVVGAYAALLLVTTAYDHQSRGFFRLLPADRYPVGAMALVQQSGLSGNLVSSPDVAGYVEWAAYPAVRVLMDMRTPEPFGAQEFWLARSVGVTLPLEALDARWPVDLVLVSRQSGVGRSLLGSTGPWSPVWADRRFLLFAHARALAGREGLRLRWPQGLDTPGPVDLDGLDAECVRLLKVDGTNAFALTERVRVALAQGRADDAHQAAEALARRFSRDAMYPYLDGIALQQLSRLAPAAVALQEALSRDPELPGARVRLAEILLAAGRPVEARAAAEEEARRRDFVLDASAWVTLGRARALCGDGPGAREAWTRALWLLPADAPLRTQVSTALAALPASSRR